MIQDHARTLVAQGREQTLREWLEYLPRGTFESPPWCVYWMGICRLPINPEESRVLFEKAFHRFREQRDIPGAFLAWSGVVDAICTGSKIFIRWIYGIPTSTLSWRNAGVSRRRKSKSA